MQEMNSTGVRTKDSGEDSGWKERKDQERSRRNGNRRTMGNGNRRKQPRDREEEEKGVVR